MALRRRTGHGNREPWPAQSMPIKNDAVGRQQRRRLPRCELGNLVVDDRDFLVRPHSNSGYFVFFPFYPLASKVVCVKATLQQKMLSSITSFLPASLQLDQGLKDQRPPPVAEEQHTEADVKQQPDANTAPKKRSKKEKLANEVRQHRFSFHCEGRSQSSHCYILDIHLRATPTSKK